MIKENALYKYKKGEGWCKHGIVYTVRDMKGNLWAIDTYDGIDVRRAFYGDKTRYLINKDIDENDLEYIMDMEDVRIVTKREFEQYDEKDRFFIPMGTRHEKYIVNKNAKPNKDLQIAQLKHEIKSLEIEIRMKQTRLERKKELLIEMEQSKN